MCTRHCARHGGGVGGCSQGQGTVSVLGEVTEEEGHHGNTQIHCNRGCNKCVERTDPDQGVCLSGVPPKADPEQRFKYKYMIWGD